jgi:hypothetical protein
MTMFLRTQAESCSQAIALLRALQQAHLSLQGFRQHLVALGHAQSVRPQVSERQNASVPSEDSSERPDEPVFQHSHATDAALVEVLPFLYQFRRF